MKNMTSNSFKNIRPLSHYVKSNSKQKLYKSYDRQISIIKEEKQDSNYLKRRIPKKIDNKSLLKKRNQIPVSNIKLLHKNNSSFGRNKPKLIPLTEEQKSKIKNIILNSELDRERNNSKGKEFYNKLSVERINFQFEEYWEYPNYDFQPSIYFFKFLANKPDYEKDKADKGKIFSSKLKLFVPDTIVLNDLDNNYWIYTDIEGNVNRVEESDNDVLEKFKPKNDKNELIAVSKMPIIKDGILGENQLTLLNMNELEKCLFSKSGSQIAIQRFVKCKGPCAFICRSVWRRDKPPYVYILTNKIKFLNEEIKNPYLKFVVNSKEPDSYSIFCSSSGRHLEETMIYMNNIVKFIESHSDIIFDELAGDFIKDEEGIWWFINLKAMKIKNIDKFKRSEGNPNPNPPQLSFFINQRIFNKSKLKENLIKFDYQNKIKCKFCGINYPKKYLKYEMTTKMILEIENLLKHVEFTKVKFNFFDNPGLRHTYSSMIYLPYRVCEDCYLLFETLNDIKDYQIEIANLFRIPVDKINFCFNCYEKEKDDISKVNLTEEELNNIYRVNKEINKINPIYEDEFNSNELHKNKSFLIGNDEILNDKLIIKEQKNLNKINNTKVLTKNKSAGNIITEKNDIKNNNNNNKKECENKDQLYLFRILIIFNDIIWDNINELPKEDLHIVYSFLGNNYKIPLNIEQYSKDLDYTLINFKKIYHVICTEPDGFINFAEKNRYMEVKLGTFEKLEEEAKNKEVQKWLKKSIIIEDQDIYNENEHFIPFASVDLSIQGLKYGTNYTNNLNGLLFKKEKPYYTGKLRCLIRIHKVKEINDVNKYILHNYCNLLIPPVNFVVSDEIPDYWIEIIERQKVRQKVLNEIIECMRKYKIKFDKKKDKNKVLQALETLVSFYAKNSA